MGKTGKTKKPRKPGKGGPTWKERVERAIRTLPREYSSEDVYAAIRKQRFPGGKSATWRDTVRRTMQELRDERGAKKVIFHKRKPGTYTSTLPTKEMEAIWARMKARLESSYDVTGGFASVEPALWSNVKGGYEHVFTFTLNPDRPASSAEDASESIRQATLELWPTYQKNVFCALENIVVENQTGTRVGGQWVQLCTTHTGARHAAATIELNYEDMSRRRTHKYHLSEASSKVVWRCEP